MSDAKAIYPSLLTLPLDRAGNASALCELALWFGRYGPNRNVEGDNGLWVETTGVAHLFGGERALIEDMLCRLSRVHLTARVGLADTYGGAYALARYGCDRTRNFAIAPPGQTLQSVGRLPVDGLRLTEDSLLLLKRLGLRHIGQAVAIPRSAMSRRFRDDAKGARRQDREALARAVVWRLDQISGETAEPKTPMEPPPHRSRRIVFAEPLISSDGIASAVNEAATALSDDLADIGEGALHVRLSLFRADGTVANLEVSVSQASQNPSHLLKLFDVKLPEVDAGLGIDVVLLAALRVGPLSSVQSNLQQGGAATKGRAAMAQLVDRLSNRLGSERVQWTAPAQSHWPERAVVMRCALDVLQRRNGRAGAGGATQRREDVGMSMPTRGARQRPQFLLDRPEPIDVLAALPEGPPARFKWRRRQCRVRLASPPERITAEWWTELPERKATAGAGQDGLEGVSQSVEGAGECNAQSKRSSRPRDYYILEDHTGSRFWVFREGLYHRHGEEDERAPQWFMHGVFA